MKHGYDIGMPNHAIDNLRQYARNLQPGATDYELRAKLSDAILAAVERGAVYDTTDPHDASKKQREVLLEADVFGVELTAVLKPDVYNPVPGREAAVTLYPTSMHETRKRVAETPVLEIPAQDLRIVSYRTGGRKHYSEMSRAAVRDEVAKLVERGVGQDTIQVWTPLELKVRRRIEVEIADGTHE